MINIIKNLFAVIGIIATLFGVITGGQQIYDTYFSDPKIPLFNNSIFITSPISYGKNNQRFINFLEKNSGEKVFLSLLMDFNYDPQFPEQVKFIDKYDFIDQDNINNVEIPISIQTIEANNFLRLNLKNNRKLVFTHNGPGSLYTNLKGAFDVEREFITINYSIYHLIETDIPYDEEMKIMNIFQAENQKRKEEFHKIMLEKHGIDLSKNSKSVKIYY